MNARAHDRLVMEQHLRRAIDNGELALLYQPLIDLNTGRMVAAEASLRWHSPELGEIPPAQFIPLAEETGFIHPLGEWELQRACREAVHWAKPRELRVAVNISSRQFHSPPRFMSSVKTALVRAIIAMADALRLEVVGEGVEEADQVAFARHNGCRFVQGYYFSRPASAAAIEDMLDHGFPLSLPPVAEVG
jgi:EAL domain-containing protein (putative c-di-GMP-specific phosphodiesterase class I)